MSVPAASAPAAKRRRESSSGAAPPPTELEVSDLRVELQSVRHSLETAQKARLRAEQEVIRLSGLLSDTGSQAEALLKRSEAAESRAAAAESSIEKFKREVLEARETVETVSKRAEKSCEEARTREVAAQDELSAANKRLSEVSQRLEALKAQADKRRGAEEAELARARKALSSVSAQMPESVVAQNQLGGLEETVKSQGKVIAELKTELAMKEQELDVMRGGNAEVVAHERDEARAGKAAVEKRLEEATRELEEFQTQLAKWVSLGKDVEDVRGALAVGGRRLQALGEENEKLEAKCTKLAEDLSKVREDLKAKEAEFSRSTKAMEKDLTVASQTVEFLRSMQSEDLKTYRNDQYDRKAVLADLCAKYEKQLQAAVKQAQTYRASLEKERELKEEAERLREKVARLESGIDYDPHTTKIIHYAANPEKLAVTAELTRLRAENEALRKGGAVPAGGVPAPPGEEVMPKKQYDRLVETFRAATIEFREVVKAALGYDVIKKGGHLYAFLSVDAASQTDVIEFKRGAAPGTVELVETPFSRSILSSSERLASWAKRRIHRAMCAQLTLDLIESSTMVL